MTPLQFLSAVWPGEGLYALATPWTPPGSDKAVYVHKVFETVDAAAAFVEREKSRTNLFFCVHSLKHEKVWNPLKEDRKTGELGAFETRTQNNMRCSRAFFLDLDVGESTTRLPKYESQAEAAADLIRFGKESGLPAPMVTSSGGGLHVYWLIDEPIPSDEWRQEAHKLHAIVRHYGLKADPARTSDSASVLRVAGTFNLKDAAHPRPVQALRQGVVTKTADFIKALDDKLIALNINLRPIPLFKAQQFDDEWGAGNIAPMEFSGPPVSLRAVAEVCAQVRDFLPTEGNVIEPLWYQAINLMRFCENGRDLVHKWSSGYPGYSYDDTERKLSQLEQKQIKPTSCYKLSEVAGNNLCEGCAFRDKVKNPLGAARYTDPAPRPIVQTLVGGVTQQVTIPSPPRPFTRTKEGMVSVQAKNKDGDEIHTIILPHDLFPLRRLVNAQQKSEHHVWRAVLPREGSKDFIMDAGALYDRKRFVEVIANNGMFPSHHNIPYLQDYMTAYIAQLQKEIDAEAQCNHLGWINEMTGFVLPDKILQQDGTARSSALSLQAERASANVQKKGMLEQQVRLMDFYNKPGYIPHQLMLLASLAAPLFFATDQHGVVLNASGEPGAGKSTALYAAASFWGQPEMYPINGTNLGATARARNARVTTLANLPVCVDEITHMQPREASDLAMSITQPNHRVVLDSHGVEKAAPGSYKATIMICTANSSLHGMLSMENVSGTAGSMRVVELILKQNYIHTKSEADEFFHQLKQHYGFIGEAFVTYAIQHLESIIARIREKMKQLDAEAKIQSSERFYTALFAPALVAGEIAYELGLLPFDVRAIHRWIVEKQIPYMRGVVQEAYTNPVGILADFLQVVNGDILLMRRFNDRPNVLQAPRGQMIGHYDIDEGLLWVLRKSFRDYCARAGAHYFKIMDECSEARELPDGRVERIVPHRKIRKVLGAGTDYAKAQSWCFAINMKHPEVSGIIDLSQQPSPPAPPVSDGKPDLKVVSKT